MDVLRFQREIDRQTDRDRPDENKLEETNGERQTGQGQVDRDTQMGRDKERKDRLID